MASISVTYPELQEGATGEIVIQLQDLLTKAGSRLRIDGYFGLGTRNAVRAFQKRNSLKVDGIVKSDTWVKLLETAGNIHISEPVKKVVKKTAAIIIPDLTEEEAEKIKALYPNAEKYYG